MGVCIRVKNQGQESGSVVHRHLGVRVEAPSVAEGHVPDVKVATGRRHAEIDVRGEEATFLGASVGLERRKGESRVNGVNKLVVW